jgi:hypothetical protein
MIASCTVQEPSPALEQGIIAVTLMTCQDMPEDRNRNLCTAFYEKKTRISSTTDLESFNLLVALQSLTPEIGTRDKNSKDCERK